MSASLSMTNKAKQSQGLLLSSTLKIKEDTVLTQKPGIVTILGCPSETPNTASASSLRRTLSADMSSEKWLSQNGSASSPMKKIASSEQLLHPKTIADSSSSSEGEDECEETKEELEAEAEAEAEAERERLEIWSSIQRNKKEEQEKAGPFDTWESIISMKNNDVISKSLPVTPYIHPLVKRSKSSLSEKSLEICTESLGSETGSDGLFPSYPPSETVDAEEEEQQQQEAEKVKEEAEEEELLQVPRYNYGAAAATKRCFPPPLPSLSRQTGPSLHMRPHRDNGRLVLEAVSLPSPNNFCVQRQDGRLVLTFANHRNQDPKEVAEKEKEKENNHVEELEEEFEGFEEEEKEDDDEDEDEYDDDEEEEEEEVGESESDIMDVESVIEKKVPLLSSGMTSVHRLAFMVNKPIGLVNRNANWSEKFNEVVNFEDEDVNVVEAASHQMAQSLPPRPRPTPRVARLIPSTPASAAAAAAASFNFNGCEYYWRTTKPAAKAANPLVHPQENNDYSTLKNNSSKIIVSGDMNRVSNQKQQQQLLVLRGKNGDYLVHNWKSCKDSRRSFLFWEPYCIATS